ncbi:cystathionine beta-lyase [Betaproteobacteria bacterium GR16-43]|nr:cystathionine beta-lyase [Betaproteobacteria bacterium GR16-43]
MKAKTKFIQGGRKAKNEARTINLPVIRASTVVFKNLAELEEIQKRFDAGEAVPTYGIANMPLRVAFEEMMAELEGGYRAVAAPSGLAAVALALMATVKAGDHVLMLDSAYGPARRFCDRTLKRFGVETTYYDPLIGEGIAALMKPNTTVVYLESPGSHTFEVQDFPAIARVARERGAAVIHDNTWATGRFFPSFEHGADLVIQAATKYPAGHSDVLIGAVVANEKWCPRLRQTAYDMGQHVSPDDLFLTLRGMRTMDVRLKQHEASGLEVARHLEKHKRVKRVLHPALPSDAGHALWKRDFRGAAGLFAIELDASPKEMAAFVDGLELFALGYSWGGYESLVVPAHMMRSVKPWKGGPLVRLQIGLEDTADLIADLEQSLGRLR